MKATRVKATITYSDMTERTAYMNVKSAMNLLENAHRNDSEDLNGIKKITIEYIEDPVMRFRSIIVGLNAGIEALRERNLELHAGNMKEILPSRVIDDLIEENDTTIDECKKLREHYSQILDTVRQMEIEYDDVTVSEDGTIINGIKREKRE